MNVKYYHDFLSNTPPCLQSRVTKGVTFLNTPKELHLSQLFWTVAKEITAEEACILRPRMFCHISCQHFAAHFVPLCLTNHTFLLSQLTVTVHPNRPVQLDWMHCIFKGRLPIIEIP